MKKTRECLCCGKRKGRTKFAAGNEPKCVWCKANCWKKNKAGRIVHIPEPKPTKKNKEEF